MAKPVFLLVVKMYEMFPMEAILPLFFPFAPYTGASVPARELSDEEAPNTFALLTPLPPFLKREISVVLHNYAPPVPSHLTQNSPTLQKFFKNSCSKFESMFTGNV